MPCFVDDTEQRHRLYVEKGELTSRLCAVFKVLERNGTLDAILSAADWVGSGVSKKSTLEWWERHKREDAARLNREAAERRRKAQRQAVLDKLSKEEKKLLGL